MQIAILTLAMIIASSVSAEESDTFVAKERWESEIQQITVAQDDSEEKKNR